MNRKQVDAIDREQTRRRLKKEKPAVYEKFLDLDRKAAMGQSPPPVIEIAYRYACNLNCDHCFASRFQKKERRLTLDDLRKLSSQAETMGVYQFILQGGEPLFWKDFDDVVNALNPRNFYMGLVTNATLLNRKRLDHLRAMGIDKIVMSLDSFDQEQYEINRRKDGIFEHTIDMLKQAKEAGLRVVINTVATTQNVRAPQLLKLVDFAKENGFIVYVNFATPIGSWEGRYDLLLTPEDADYIYQLNCEHEIIKRDIYPFKGVKVPCPALRSVVYITEYGDVLPCPFLHIAVGNILQEPLADILRRGMTIKWFKYPPSVCLASEDRDFIKNKIAVTYGKSSPVDMHDVFGPAEIEKENT
ncbi:MAG TPA: radical SAM protein [Smithellaceae bacterium]|nr:radical SAM protein [Smithellaceae bacterium]